MLGHTDASEAHCIDCGKLLSLGSNKSGKQTVHGLKCHLENATNEKSGISSTRTTCIKAKLGEVLAAHCTADLLTECMKRKKLILSGDFRFRFSTENECPFSFLFRVRP